MRYAEFKTLPKHIHGEFKTLKHRADTIRARIEELQALEATEIATLKVLEETEIDTSNFYNTNPAEKYYNKWLDNAIAQGRYYKPEFGNNLYALAWQSCWPDESSTMIFQYFHDYLDIRFKWWASMKWSTDERIKLASSPSRTICGALPNINGTFYQCAGDYGTKFMDGSRILKMHEFYNYTSSPNLRENGTVTSIYSKVAVAFQYSNVEIKRGTEIEVTNIAKLWIEMLMFIDDEDAAYNIVSNQCSHCGRSNEHITRSIYPPKGKETTYNKFDYFRRVLELLHNDYDEALKVIHYFDMETIKTMTNHVNLPDACKLCVLGTFRFKDAKAKYEKFKSVYDEIFYPEEGKETEATIIQTPEPWLDIEEGDAWNTDDDEEENNEWEADEEEDNEWEGYALADRY